MANDRLYLRCECGEVFLLAKWWGWPFRVFYPDPKPLEDWLGEHQSCARPDQKKPSQMGVPWTIVGEHDLLVEPEK